MLEDLILLKPVLFQEINVSSNRSYTFSWMFSRVTWNHDKCISSLTVIQLVTVLHVPNAVMVGSVSGGRSCCTCGGYLI